MNLEHSFSRRAFTTALSATGIAMSTKEPNVPPPARSQVNSSITIQADFGKLVDYPIIKSKFAVFNSCIVPLSTYERDAEFFAIARPESLRIDLGWGTDWAGWTKQPITGTAEAPVLQMEEMDAIARILNDAGVLPYWSYCYTPSPLQDPPGAWRSVPRDMNQLATTLGMVARHYRDIRATNPVGYHEIFNEPDNDDFTVGDMDDYFAMYEHGSVAVRENDPEGLVGGPALAFTYSWIEPFVDLVARKNLPFDFFSTHVYGTNDGFSRLDRMLDASRDSLQRYPQFSTVEIHLNEFNSYVIDYPIDGTQQKHRLAAAFLRDMAHLLARPEVTLVHWAQFLDSGSDNYSGMISIDGHRKALFNAAEIYARLPIDRVQLEMNISPDVGGMAGVEEHRAGLVIWNLAPGRQDVMLSLANLPFSTGTIHEYRIDADHSSWGDGTAIEHLEETHSGPLDSSWSTTIGGGGVLYLEIEDGSRLPGIRSRAAAQWRRTHHYYPDRSTSAWADFDKATWTFRLGSANDAAADVEIGVTAVDLAQVLHFSCDISGTPQSRDRQSLLGLRLDYSNGENYIHSVLIHGPVGNFPAIFSETRDATMPWGTHRNPDQNIRVEDFGNFALRPADYAPASWSGMIQVTAIMHSVGPNVIARMTIQPS